MEVLASMQETAWAWLREVLHASIATSQCPHHLQACLQPAYQAAYKMPDRGPASNRLQSLTCASGMSISIGHSASCKGSAKFEASRVPRGLKPEGQGSTRADSSALALSSLARSSRCADKTYCCSVQGDRS